MAAPKFSDPVNKKLKIKASFQTREQQNIGKSVVLKQVLHMYKISSKERYQNI